MAHLFLTFLLVSAFLSLEFPRPTEFDFGDLLDYFLFFAALDLGFLLEFRIDCPFKKFVTCAG